MHNVEIKQDIIDRILYRRGRVHMFDSFPADKTAMVVIDMQNFFCEPNTPTGAQVERPVTQEIVPALNELAAGVRQAGSKVIWVRFEIDQNVGATNWDIWFKYIVGDPEKIEQIKKLLEPGGHGTKLWHALDVQPEDWHIVKNRYSALTPGSSSLERLLRSAGIENIILTGTGTHVCVESTGRDAMALDYKVVMVSDCCAAHSDAEHLATLETFIQQFGDVMTKDEVLAILRGRKN